MNFRSLTATAAFGCLMMASCYPYKETRPRSPNAPPNGKSVSAAEQQKIKAQREAMKNREEANGETEKMKDREKENSPAGGNPDGGSITEKKNTATPEKEKNWPTANKVPGKEGQVFSPYNNKVIDVSGMASGILVADPTYPESAMKRFFVP